MEPDLTNLLSTGGSHLLRRQEVSWYSAFCNRWVALAGCVAKLVLMFLIHWVYALVFLTAIAFLYLYIGMKSTGFTPGEWDLNTITMGEVRWSI